MLLRRFVVLILFCLPPGFVGPAQAAPQETLWLVPHTHWEGAVFKTREEYLEIGLPHIVRALTLLKSHPQYRFTLDQVCYVKPFLERYPEEEAAFRQFVAEGRLQLVGGVDTMHDNNMPGGESIVHQILYGKGYYREKLGVDVTVGWALDTFGHNAQMPQLLKLGGYRSYWFRRGVPTMDLPAEFLWKGIDGTEIPAFWMAYSYGLFWGSPRNLLEFTGFFKERYNALTARARGVDRVGLAGADVSEPEEHLPPLVSEFNAAQDAPFSIRFAVPTEFEAVAEKRGNRPSVSGEFNPVFQGIYSSRIEIKQRTRLMEGLLSAAEKLAAINQGLGFAEQIPDFDDAWEPVLFNQAHDLASGVMADSVYADSLRDFEYAKRRGDTLIHHQLDQLVGRIDTRGEGLALVVFNPLAWPRSDIVETDVSFSERGVTDIQLQNDLGKVVPVQILEAQRNGDGSLKTARVAFVARDIPALGHAVHHLVPKRERPSVGGIPPATGNLARYSASHQDVQSIENDFYRLTFNLWTGEITSLVMKQGNWEVLSGPGNVVAAEHDGGDFWELYGLLNGGRALAMSTLHGVPTKAQFSNQWVGGNGAVRSGPVISEYSVTHPLGNNNFETVVRLYTGLRRIDITTQILNKDRFLRYRVLFPTSIRAGKSVHEIPFGAIERKLGIEYPAQNWIDYGDGQRGLTLLNRGLPGNNVVDGTMMLSLMRSAKLLLYPTVGGFDPSVSSDTGLELDKKLRFQYSLVPHAGDWQEARTYRDGMELNHPLILRKATSHPGPLGKRWGLLEISHPNVVVTALKPRRDGTLILRLYEATGSPATGVTVKLTPGLAVATEVNLMEDDLRPIDVRNNRFQFDLRGYEIKTFKLKARPLPRS
ncbi:MAG: glycoside hydrolase family 38 C-terminal domain-containing protein [Acidobacteriota bacterium]